MRGPSSFEDLAAVIAVCIGTARSDDEFAQTELDAIINGLKSQYDFTGREDLLQEYVKAGNAMDPKEAIERIKNFDAEEKQFVSDMLFLTIASDGKLAPEEKEIYNNMLSVCGLPMFSGAKGADEEPEEEETNEEADKEIIPAFILANFYGIASLKQSYNEDWNTLGDEIASWMGCSGVQVVRFTQALNAISEKLGLNGRHLVFMVARNGYGDKTVGDNMTATILYGGGYPIYGNIVFALETDKGYVIEGIRTQSLLDEVYATVNEAVGGLLRTE